METKLENFTVSKVGIAKNGDVIMHYFLDLIGDGVKDIDHHKTECSKEPLDSFSEIFDEFKPTIARVYKFDGIRVIAGAKKFGATKDQVLALEKHYQDILDKIKIELVSMSNFDTDDNKLVSINAFFEDDFGHSLPIKTKDILLSTTKIGTESDLEDACNRLIKECYKYKIEGLSKEPEIPGFGAPKPKKQDNKKTEKAG